MLKIQQELSGDFTEGERATINVKTVEEEMSLYFALIKQEQEMSL